MADQMPISNKLHDQSDGVQPESCTPRPPAPVRRIHCPHCQNPLDLAEEQTNEEVVCPGCGSSFRLRETQQTTTTQLMRPLGKFQLLERVGLGAFGTVWRARDMELDRIVALKLPHAGLLSSETDRERFYREARLAAQLRHPGIVTVHEVATLDGTPAIVSEFIDGLPLQNLLQLRPFTFRDAAALMADIADAVDYAHQMGLVHRDLKPSNIMVEYGRRSSEELASEGRSSTTGCREIGRPLVMDFGLALRPEVELTLTVDGQVLGTPAYMSPEQAAGKGHQADRRSDVYSLGVIFYEILSGELPFRGSKLMLLHQVLHEEPRPPRKIRDKIPRDLETICLKAMAKSPKRRYQTARELADDLRRYLNREPIQARPVAAWERGWRWVQRRPTVAGLLLVSTVALLASVGAAVALVAFRETEKARQEAVDARGEADSLRAQAEFARDDADSQRAEAVRQRGEAERQRLEAEKQRALAQRYLYASDMNLADRAWQETQLPRMLELLERHRPQAADGEDLRGLEWHHLWRLCHSDLLTLKGHTNAVLGVAFSPDGQRLASASEDRTVKLWDARTGQEILNLIGHANAVLGVVFSPNGQRLASASADHTVKVWDARAGMESLTLKGHTAPITALTFSPDGQRLASASYDQTVKVWDALTGQETLNLKGHTSYVTSVAFSPDGLQLASASADQTVKVWDARTGQETLTLKGHTGSVFGVAFNPAGQRLASASADHTVKVWDARTGHETLNLKGHLDAVSSVAYSPDGQRLASASYDQTVKVWDALTGQETLNLKGHTSYVTSVAFSPDGLQLASASADQTVKVWDAHIGLETLPLKGHLGVVSAAALSPDGQRLASVNQDGIVKVWNTRTGEGTLTLEGQASAVSALAFSSDGQRLTLATGNKAMKVWDARTGQEILIPKRLSTGATAVALSLDGHQVALGNQDGTVKVWDTRTGEETLTLKGPTNPVSALAFGPEGQRMASASEDGTVKVWNARTGQETFSLKGQTSYVTAVAFSPDGQRLALASQDGTVKVWDARTGQETITPKGQTSYVTAVAFSLNGQRLVWVSQDGTVKVWEFVSSEEELRKRRAVLIVRGLFEMLVSEAEVLGHLRQDQFLSEPFKSELVAIAKAHQSNPDDLNQKSWVVVRDPVAPAMARERALRQAREACRLKPDNGVYLNTFGVALYRTGQYLAAQETLARTEKLNTATFKTPQTADLAFLAMAQYRLGKREDAQQTLARLRKAARDPRWAKDAESRAFIEEAENLLQEPAAPELGK